MDRPLPPAGIVCKDLLQHPEKQPTDATSAPLAYASARRNTRHPIDQDTWLQLAEEGARMARAAAATVLILCLFQPQMAKATMRMLLTS
jgi:hypothetical protein